MSLYNENEPPPPPPDDNFIPVEFPPEPEYVPVEAPVETVQHVVETVHPPVERQVIIEERLRPADRSTMSQATMIFGLAALSLAMVGGAFFVLDVFQNGLTDNIMGILVKVVPIALAYIVAWTLCLWSIRSFSNLVLPFIIRYYMWITLTGLVILYLKIMQKLFEQSYDWPHFISYNLLMAACLVVLIGLHLLLEQPNLRRYSIPIIMACTWHLILMVVRFVVLDPGNPIYLFGDLYFFIVMFGLAALMLAHLGLLNPLRATVDAFFQPSDGRAMVG